MTSFERGAKINLLVTGASGFIGAVYIDLSIQIQPEFILSLDKSTGYFHNQAPASLPNFRFSRINLVDFDQVQKVVIEYRPGSIVHFAAESHVDRSIDSPGECVRSNVVGTYNLLEAARAYYESLQGSKRDQFRFHYISTDEVYGSIQSGAVDEGASYNPSSPYSATKAAGDHLVMAWYHTYGLPVIITHCTNNYGPYQHPEKLIPHMILRALSGQPLPVYGSGLNRRDWLYVEDHVTALMIALNHGKIGERYNIAGHQEKTNLEVVESICRILDALVPKEHSYLKQIEFVADRPGHDFRYAIDDSKFRTAFNWEPKESFESGLLKTVKWYLKYYQENLSTDSINLDRQGVIQ